MAQQDNPDQQIGGFEYSSANRTFISFSRKSNLRDTPILPQHYYHTHVQPVTFAF